jgi:hypothetical protein
MKRIEPRIFWGILLIAGGLLFLLANLGLLIIDNIWPVVFAVPSAVFIYIFLTHRENWWAIIPGLTLLGLATLIAFDQLFPSANENWGAAIFLGSLALSFLAVYIRTATHEWWAIIPAGVLGTIALVIVSEELLRSSTLGGAIFMLGLAATFGLVYVLPSPGGRMQWAIYPASILGGIGLLILIASTPLSGIIGPAAIIALGLYLIFRTRSADEL